MSIQITWDISDFNMRSAQIIPAMTQAVSKAVGEAGDELLRLSALEVPHDTGELQNSGKVDKGDLEASVSYNTPYAVRMHEHPEYKFQKGRKGKYLEDPLKNNISKFRNIINNEIKESLK